MKRLALVACAAFVACSVYGDDARDTPSAPTIAIDGGDDGASGAEKADGAVVTIGDGTLDAGDLPGPSDSGSTVDAALPDLYVFITSTKMTGKFAFLDALTKADSICQNLANTHPQLSAHTFVAWMSGNGASANQRVAAKAAGRRYVRIDHAFVLTASENMASQATSVPISLTEQGTILLPDETVWTGTNGAGMSNALDCANWGSELPDDMGIFGVPLASSAWNYSNFAGCDELRHLYCFEVP